MLRVTVTYTETHMTWFDLDQPLVETVEQFQAWLDHGERCVKVPLKNAPGAGVVLINLHQAREIVIKQV